MTGGAADRPGLPAGLTTRALTLADAEAVAALVGAEEEVDLGEAEMTVADVLSDWQRPSYDVAASTMGVLDGPRLVGYADVATAEHAYTAVHPDLQGRGIGTWLAHWVQDTARRRGSTSIGSQVPRGSAADRLMADLGYRLHRTAWDLELPEGAEVVARPLPPGHTLRDATPADHEAVWTLVEDAFLEWDDRERRMLADFGSLVWDRPGAAPWNLRLVHDSEGALVGATHVYLSGDADPSAYVARLAVRADRRGQGLARVMLVDAFGLARAHGAVRCFLSTDSRTGALGLYERVGMVVSSTWVYRAVDL